MKEVLRNEILEAGQIVILYFSVNWMGNNRGVGELIRANEEETDGDGAITIIKETWIIRIEDVGYRRWVMINPNNLTKDMMCGIIYP